MDRSSTFNKLEDELTCAVCLEIFQHPKLLTCQHTLCEGCLEDMACGATEVTCPHCREVTPLAKVKGDFRAQKMVDLFHLEKRKKTVGSRNKPSVTTEETDRVRVNTDDEELFEKFRQQLDQAVSTRARKINGENEEPQYVNVEEAEAEVSQKLVWHKIILKEVEKLELDCDEMVNLNRREGIKIQDELLQGKEEFIKMINQHFEKEKLKLLDLMERNKKEIEMNYTTKIQRLRHLKEEIAKANSKQVIKQRFDELTKELSAGSQDLHGKYEQSKVFLVNKNSYMDAFDEQKSLRVTEERDKALVRSDKTPSNDSWLAMAKQPFHLKHDVQVSANITYILSIDDKLWCLSENELVIRDKSGKNLKTIQGRIQTARGMAVNDVTKDVIVASKKSGLLPFDSDGKCLGRVDYGEFWQVTCYNNKVYAGKKENDTLAIHIFEARSPGQYARLETVTLDHFEDNGYKVTFGVTPSGFYLCSEGSHCLYKIDLTSGRIGKESLGHFGTDAQGGSLYHPLIAQQNGNELLIVDGGNKRIQLLDVTLKKWQIIPLQSSPKHPSSATIDANNSLYIAGGRYPDYTLSIFNKI